MRSIRTTNNNRRSAAIRQKAAERSRNWRLRVSPHILAYLDRLNESSAQIRLETATMPSPASFARAGELMAEAQRAATQAMDEAKASAA